MSTSSGPATLEDVRICGHDVAAARRVHAAVHERRKTNPNFTRNDLYRELQAGSRQAPAAPSAASSSAQTSSTITLEDIAKAALDVNVSRRVMTAVDERRKTDPNFALDDLRRELEAGARHAPAAGAAVAVSVDDFQRSGLDNAAARRIMAVVDERRKTDPKFTAADLLAEMQKSGSRSAAPATASADPNEPPLRLGVLGAGAAARAARGMSTPHWLLVDDDDGPEVA